MEFVVGIWFVVSVFDLIYMLDVIVVLTLCCLVPLVHLVFTYTFITKRKAIRNIFRSTFISAVNKKIT